MTTWAIILSVIAGAAITSHAFVLLCYTASCYHAWQRANGVDGFLRIAGRAALAAVVYGVLAVGVGGPSFVIVSMLGLSPSLEDQLGLFAQLGAHAVVATYALPLLATGWNFPIMMVIVLIAFFVLGLITMLPGLGYGSGRVWGAVGLAAYVTYFALYALSTFANTSAKGDTYIAWFVLIAIGVSLSFGAMRLYLRVRPGPSIGNTQTKSSPAAPPVIR